MNIIKMTNISIKFSVAIKVILKVKNWTCPILHYFSIKNDECVAKFRNGTKCIIRDKSDAVVFLENFFLNAYDLEKGFDIKENDVIIDVGAHVGYFTIYAAQKAKNGKIVINDLQGGTFTISNGGIYGSMLSTPIINPPQTGVLGMHNIVDRAVVREGNVVVRPIMYLALSYDHRIIDGKEAVSFLKTIKECLEEPRRLFLDL